MAVIIHELYHTVSAPGFKCYIPLCVYTNLKPIITFLFTLAFSMHFGFLFSSPPPSASFDWQKCIKEKNTSGDRRSIFQYQSPWGRECFMHGNRKREMSAELSPWAKVVEKKAFRKKKKLALHFTFSRRERFFFKVCYRWFVYQLLLFAGVVSTLQ